MSQLYWDITMGRRNGVKHIRVKRIVTCYHYNINFSRINTKLHMSWQHKTTYLVMTTQTYHRGWQYSESLFTILKEYVEKFPELFKELEDHLKKDNINASDIATKLGPEFKWVLCSEHDFLIWCVPFTDNYKFGRYMLPWPTTINVLL